MKESGYGRPYGGFLKPFDKIYALTRKRRYANALNALLERENKINKRYASDKSDENHSWYIVGEIFYKKRKYKDALRAFRRAITAWSKDGEAMWAMGNCYSELGRPSIAERYFQKSLRHAKNNHRATIRYNLGNALFDQGRYGEAIKQYKKISRKEEKIYKLARKNIEKSLKLRQSKYRKKTRSK